MCPNRATQAEPAVRQPTTPRMMEGSPATHDGGLTLSAGSLGRIAYAFGEHYRRADMWTPPQLRRREWGFFHFADRPPSRHVAFDTQQELRTFLINRYPRHCFHSTTYWQRPHERRMVDKGWLGADLIFDLDGDHIPGIEDTDFTNMMKHVQLQAHRLWHEFLAPDLGFKEEHLQVTFSGHRGFHLHYRDPAMWHLDSAARREIVNWIRGEGLNVELRLTQENLADVDGADGWTKRLSAKLGEMADRAAVATKDSGELAALRAELLTLGKGHGIGPGKVDGLLGRLQVPRIGDQVRAGRFDALGGSGTQSNQHVQTLMTLVKEASAIALGTAGETDEVVTIDVRRIIRWLTSLHGKTGLQVTELDLARLDPDHAQPFDALQEALVLPASETLRVEVDVERAWVRLRGRDLELARGQVLELDLAAAAFLMLKGWAHELR